MSNSLGPDQARQNVRPDLGSNCLQKLAADNTKRQRVDQDILHSSSGSIQAFHQLFESLAILQYIQGSYRQVCVKFKDFSRTSKDYPTVFKD